MFIVYTDNICSTRPDEEFHFKIYFKMLWVVKLSNAETLFFFLSKCLWQFTSYSFRLLGFKSFGSWFRKLKIEKKNIFSVFKQCTFIWKTCFAIFFTENCKISLELKCAEIVFYSLEYKYKIFACHLYFRSDHINLADENEPLGLTRLIFSRINSIYSIYCC